MEKETTVERSGQPSEKKDNISPERMRQEISTIFENMPKEVLGEWYAEMLRYLQSKGVDAEIGKEKVRTPVGVHVPELPPEIEEKIKQQLAELSTEEQAVYLDEKGLLIYGREIHGEARCLAYFCMTHANENE